MARNTRKARAYQFAAVIAGLLLCMMAQGVEAETARLARTAATSSAMDIQSIIDNTLWLSTMPGYSQRSETTMEDPLSRASTEDAGSPADFEGIRRDTYYFMGLQVAVVGTLYFLPESVSGWSDQQKNRHHAKKWWDNVSGPEIDEDRHYINYVLHPYWGAAYYVRARERGYDAEDAFWYSFLLSTLYEAGLEALFEPVSIQDLFVTPIVGSWLGAHFMRWRDATRVRMADRGHARFRDKVLLVATDPLGNAADFVDRRLNPDADVQAFPFVTTLRAPSLARGGSGGDDARGLMYGVTVMVRW